MVSTRKLHCYAASFGDDLAKRLLTRHGKKGCTVLDPFAGSGTTLIQALLKGMKPIGIDVDPISNLICRVVTKRYTVEWLDLFENEVSNKLTYIKAHLLKARLPFGKMKRNVAFSVNGYRAHLPDRQEIDFWFSSKQKAVLASLMAYVRSLGSSRKSDILSCAISSSIIRKWPNTISRAMDIDHSRPHKSSPPKDSIEKYFSLFQRIFTGITQTLRQINSHPDWEHGKAEIHLGDCVKVMEKLKDRTIDLVLTSPPYVNAIDYPRAHKFAEWWLDPEGSACQTKNYVGLRKKSQLNITDNARIFLAKHGCDIDLLAKFSSAMARQMAHYFDDMYYVMKNCFRVLRPKSTAILVLADNICDGKRVPIVQVVAEIMREVGFKTVDVGYRNIKPSRRRYPLAFLGVMRNEAIITAVK